MSCGIISPFFLPSTHTHTHTHTHTMANFNSIDFQMDSKTILESFLHILTGKLNNIAKNNPVQRKLHWNFKEDIAWGQLCFYLIDVKFVRNCNLTSRVEVPGIISAEQRWFREHEKHQRWSALFQSCSALIFSESALFRSEKFSAISGRISSESALFSADFLSSETSGFQRWTPLIQRWFTLN